MLQRDLRLSEQGLCHLLQKRVKPACLRPPLGQQDEDQAAEDDSADSILLELRCEAAGSQEQGCSGREPKLWG